MAGYDSGLLFAQMDYMASTKGHGGLQGRYSFYSQYKCGQGAMASSKVEWQAMSGRGERPPYCTAVVLCTYDQKKR